MDFEGLGRVLESFWEGFGRDLEALGEFFDVIFDEVTFRMLPYRKKNVPREDLEGFGKVWGGFWRAFGRDFEPFGALWADFRFPREPH